MISMLASARCLEEVEILLRTSVEIVDLKEPSQGALGALSLALVRSIVEHVQGQKILSATVGDLPMNPELLSQAVWAMHLTGVDIVKVGFFGSSYHSECLDKLSELARQGVRIVAVLMADQSPDFSMIPKMKAAQFYGVMLDTADKQHGGLLAHQSKNCLEGFVNVVKQLDLKVGLAGSLQKESIPELSELKPDYLGFRSALCVGHSRTHQLDPERVEQIYGVLRKSNIPNRTTVQQTNTF